MDEADALVSNYLGVEVPKELCEAYHETALRKWKWIVDREGDAGGERLQPYYLAQLIAEAIRADVLTYECMRNFEDKKRAARIADNPNTQPHYSAKYGKSQEQMAIRR